MSLLRRWWLRPARTPAWLRTGLALVLATTALFGIFAAPSRPDVTPPGPLAAEGGPPTGLADAPTKRPEPPGPGDRVQRFPDSPQLRAEGATLYANGCASCHGTLLQGRDAMGPSLIGVGTGPVNFYVSTGRMPLQDPTDEPQRAHRAYDPQQTDALIAYIHHVGGGPQSAAADPSAGTLATGLSQFTEHCAGCHQVVGRGGMTIGAWVPNLQAASALQVAEAVRMGPYVMPHFDSTQIDQNQLDSLARYILWTRHPDNAGGWGIYNIGPIPEGMAAWFIALLAMVLVARLIGERTGSRVR